MIVLLSVIFLSFIGLGLPDTVIGSIWPVIQKERKHHLLYMVQE